METAQDAPARLSRLLAVFALGFATTYAVPAFAEDVPVDVELVLAVDTSGSMKDEELHIQRKGYADAFRSREVVDAIRFGHHGRVAVTYVEWGAASSRRIILPWTMIETEADAREAADTIERADIRNLFQTSISGAIRHGRRAFDDNAFAGARRVIDISGDGPNNEGGLVTVSRDNALADSITINGLPLILGDNPNEAGDGLTLDTYYADCVIGGPRSFIIPVNGLDQFPQAVRRKLVLELSGRLPPPRPIPIAAGPPTDCTIGEKLWDGVLDN